MGLVVVERSFVSPTRVEEIRAVETATASTFEANGVTLVQAHFSKDGQHMFSLYDAEDLEAVRASHDAAAIPYDDAWCADRVIPAQTKPLNPRFVSIVVQRALRRPTTLEAIAKVRAESASCMMLYRVHLQESLLAPNGVKAICRYAAPDAESVRLANQKARIPFVRAWASVPH